MAPQSKTTPNSDDLSNRVDKLALGQKTLEQVIKGLTDGQRELLLAINDMNENLESKIRNLSYEVDSELSALREYTESGFETINDRFDHLEDRFDDQENRFDRLEDRFDRLESRVDTLIGPDTYEH